MGQDERPYEQMNHYERLGVERTASEREIKRAHRDLMKEMHPDNFRGPYRDHMEEIVKGINAVRDVLVDPVQRRRYDSELEYHEGRSPNASAGNNRNGRDAGSPHSSEESGYREGYQERRRYRERQRENQHSQNSDSGRSRQSGFRPGAGAYDPPGGGRQSYQDSSAAHEEAQDSFWPSILFREPPPFPSYRWFFSKLGSGCAFGLIWFVAYVLVVETLSGRGAEALLPLALFITVLPLLAFFLGLISPVASAPLWVGPLAIAVVFHSAFSSLELPSEQAFVFSLILISPAFLIGVVWIVVCSWRLLEAFAAHYRLRPLSEILAFPRLFFSGLRGDRESGRAWYERRE